MLFVVQSVDPISKYRIIVSDSRKMENDAGESVDLYTPRKW